MIFCFLEGAVSLHMNMFIPEKNCMCLAKEQTHYPSDEMIHETRSESLSDLWKSYAAFTLHNLL